MNATDRPGGLSEMTLYSLYVIENGLIQGQLRGVMMNIG